MPKPPKRPRDVNQWAKRLTDLATGSTQEAQPNAESPLSERGRKGGLKGGDARAKRLPAKRRKEIATKAAKARWKR